MSVRAYKIIKYAEEDTFNFWHDDLFMELFEEVVTLDFLGIDGSTGYFEITEEQLKEMKKKFKEIKDRYPKEQQERTIEIFKQIEKDFAGRGYCTYLAF